MTHFDTTIIGHITMDINTDYDGKKEIREGGAVLYSAAAAHSAEHAVRVVTKLSKNELGRLEAFTLPQSNILCLASLSDTDMVNTYFTPDRERRVSLCTSRGDPFSSSDIPTNESSSLYQLAGLLKGDYSDDLLPYLAQRGRTAVDMQGFLRCRKDNGEMFLADWDKKREVLPYIDFLKADAAEAEVLTGTDDRRRAAEILYSWGAKEVFITHNSEILAYDGDKMTACPIRARNLSGRTGRGDTSFAIYTTERLTTSVKTALVYATSAASYKMKRPGVLDCTRKELESYLTTYYQDYIN